MFDGRNRKRYDVSSTSSRAKKNTKVEPVIKLFTQSMTSTTINNKSSSSSSSSPPSVGNIRVVQNGTVDRMTSENNLKLLPKAVQSESKVKPATTTTRPTYVSDDNNNNSIRSPICNGALTENLQQIKSDTGSGNAVSSEQVRVENDRKTGSTSSSKPLAAVVRINGSMSNVGLVEEIVNQKFTANSEEPKASPVVCRYNRNEQKPGQSSDEFVRSLRSVRHSPNNASAASVEAKVVNGSVDGVDQIEKADDKVTRIVNNVPTAPTDKTFPKAAAGSNLHKPAGTISNTVDTIPNTVGTISNRVGTVPNIVDTVPNTVGTVPNTVGTVPNTVGTVPSTVSTVLKMHCNTPKTAGNVPSTLTVNNVLNTNDNRSSQKIPIKVDSVPKRGATVPTTVASVPDTVRPNNVGLPAVVTNGCGISIDNCNASSTLIRDYSDNTKQPRPSNSPSSNHLQNGKESLKGNSSTPPIKSSPRNVVTAVVKSCDVITNGHSDDAKVVAACKDDPAAHLLQIDNRNRVLVAEKEDEKRRDLDDDDDDDEPDHPYFIRKAEEVAGPVTILNRRGSIRGVRNQVRSNVATFADRKTGKESANYAVLENGKVVLYTTSVSIVRETHDKCLLVRRILETHMVDYEERDIFLSKESHRELIHRAGDVELPQVFLDGYQLGSAKEIERLNEVGTLKKIFRHFKKRQQPKCCTNCGGYRYVPCTSCHGSKKSRRNCFTEEFSALRCTFCDENGLVKCEKCNRPQSESGAAKATKNGF